MKLKATNKNYFRKDEKRDEKRDPESIIFRKKGFPPAKKSGVIANGGRPKIAAGRPGMISGALKWLSDILLLPIGPPFLISGHPEIIPGALKWFSGVLFQKNPVRLLNQGNQKR